MSPSPPLHLVVSPLALAAYAGWLAVFVQAGSHLAMREPQLGLAARALMLLYLIGFVRELLDERDRRRPWDQWGLALMGLAATGVLLLGPAATSPILMVIFAAALGARLGDRALAVALLTIVATVTASMSARWGLSGRTLVLQVASFASFIVFAAVVLRSGRTAERLAEDLRQTNAHLLSTRELLAEAARDGERLRLSRELHDIAGHKLTALKLNLTALARRPGFADEPGIHASLLLADELLHDLRGLVEQFRRHDGVDLGQAIRRLAQALPRPRIALDIDADARVPDAQRAECLLRVAQEGLTNCARHAGAHTCRLSLRRRDDIPALELCVDDDGHARWPLREGHGLTGMRERLQALDGRLTLEPSPMGGLRLCAVLPTAPPA